MTDLTGQVLSKRYELQEMIGKGGMGEVYRGRHILMKKTVAIKVLHPALTEREEAVERFRREAQAASHIQHPNICAASDFGEAEDGSFFLVMEFLEGESLKTSLAKESPIGAERTCHIIAQIVMALEQAHKASIIHRDLKPDNVFLIERHGLPDFVKLLDFGLASVHEEESPDSVQLTQAGKLYGTPLYMSPEQAQGENLDHRTDLYALGVMFYEMLTGSTPFDGSNFMKLLWQHASDPPPTFKEMAPDLEIPSALEEIVQKLIAKDPDDRHASAAEVLADLEGSGYLNSQQLAMGSSSVYSILSLTGVTRPKSAPSKKKSSPADPSGESGLRPPTASPSLKARLQESAQSIIAKISPLIETARVKFAGLPPKAKAGVLGGAAVFFLLILILLFSGGEDPLEDVPKDTTLVADNSTNNETAPPVGETTKIEPEAAPTLQLEEAISALKKEHPGISKGLKKLRKKKGRRSGLKLFNKTAKTLPPSAALFALKIHGHRVARQNKLAVGFVLELHNFSPEALQEPFVKKDLMSLLGAGEKDGFSDFKIFLTQNYSPFIRDMLAESAAFGKGRRQRNNAKTLLSEHEGALAELEPWLQHSIGFRNGKSCKIRKSELKKIAALNDPRTLPLVQIFHKEVKDCSVFDSCHECMQILLKKTFKSLRAKKSLLKKSSPQKTEH